MHILILEARLTGHHPVYLERIASSLIKFGHKVTLAFSAKYINHPLASRLCKNYHKKVAIHAIDDAEIEASFSSKLGDVGREIALRRVFANAFTEISTTCRVDHVMLPYLDYCLYAMALLGAPFKGVDWSGICMRPSFHYSDFCVIAPRPRYAKIKKTLFFRLLRNRSLTKIFTIDELLHSYSSENAPTLAKKIKYLPDPAELRGIHTRNSARTALGIPDEHRVILIYGAIDERKGLAELVNAFKLPQLSTQTSLLIAGKQSEWAKQLLNTPTAQALRDKNQLFELNRFTTDEEQQMVFAAADIVWLGYKNHYSMSGVLVLAALAKKPTISTPNGLIGYYTKKWNAGTILEGSIQKSLDEIQLNSVATQEISEAHLHIHTWEMVEKMLTTLIPPADSQPRTAKLTPNPYIPTDHHGTQK